MSNKRNLEGIDLDNSESDAESAGSRRNQLEIGDIIREMRENNEKHFQKLLALFETKNMTIEQFESFSAQLVTEFMTKKSEMEKRPEEMGSFKKEETFWRKKVVSQLPSSSSFSSNSISTTTMVAKKLPLTLPMEIKNEDTSIIDLTDENDNVEDLQCEKRKLNNSNKIQQNLNLCTSSPSSEQPIHVKLISNNLPTTSSNFTVRNLTAGSSELINTLRANINRRSIPSHKRYNRFNRTYLIRPVSFFTLTSPQPQIQPQPPLLNQSQFLQNIWWENNNNNSCNSLSFEQMESLPPVPPAIPIVRD